MTEMYKCDICSDVVEFPEIRRNVGMILFHQYDWLVSVFDKPTSTFRMTRLETDSTPIGVGLKHMPKGSDMCRKCHDRFKADFKQGLERINRV